ncbi:molybdopterin molybdenumtransferase MoeA [Thermococci archaeon]|uniref:molybdenum cofactor synthesis domain-containing protein n=1 Tax=Palaeococcus sp. (in: euryarchaeotes) TaxID=2820298 RepID=UPI000F15E12B|nr:gephyrin-like molybdotransferase Glp [Palaeococcus sp. (in: euryarchaeotes)]MCD6559454.1 molybdopterin molybdenumtransferase MoeA [Palaeococcus sp. (in: euryarchaeotes)]RLF76141.1 MAG: molybdopterin molybdenumtransferase MoeA [Thermococci archaeon]RLF88946.1 MAG: molybdopterin molybdenumtransferase MoeA [Thermococci archaeon]
MGFLKVVHLEEALNVIASFNLEPQIEEVALENALGRILAEDVEAPIDVPPFDRATVDGYALKSDDTWGANESEPVRLKLVGQINAGDIPSFKLKKGEAVGISTGAPLPEGADAVAMLEEVDVEGDEVLIYKPYYPQAGVMKAGSDIPKGKKVLEAPKKLTFKDTALLSALGFQRVKVFRKPKVAIVSTGNEVILPGEALDKGKIYDINGRAISDAIREIGGEAFFLGIARDDEESLREKIFEGLKCDMVILSGGASAGVRDLTSSIIEEHGEVYVHGIAIQPGKPTIIGQIDGKPVFGLPGYPTSCLTNFTLLIAPLLRRLLGLKEEPNKVKKKLAHKIFSVKGRRQFLPVRVEGEKAIPILKGSGAVTSFVDADGFIEIPETVEILEEGEEVEVFTF